MNVKRPFHFQEHTADVIVVAYGGTLEEAFENSALALFEVMSDTKKVEPRIKDVFEVEGVDKQSLLYSWIENFIIEFDVNLKLYSKFNVEKIRRKRGILELRASAWGEAFNPKKHIPRSEVKAVTYHEMEIIENDGVRVKFLLDI